MSEVKRLETAQFLRDIFYKIKNDGIKRLQRVIKLFHGKHF